MFFFSIVLYFEFTFYESDVAQNDFEIFLAI